MEIFFTIIAVVGLLFATAGILGRNELKSDYLHVVAGICLLTYSIHIKNTVFIVMQTVFILGTMYEIFKISREKRNKK
jgi:lipid-A-disaccharide synthase-like uncharacterized protein